MPPDAKTLDAIDESGCGLRVTFVWHRDRYAHTITMINNRRVTPLLASQEGVDQDTWPPSPPLQNLTIERRRDTHQVGLLVGMAGTSHWSLSVEADSQSPQLIFDAACRVKETPRQMASSYRTMAKPEFSEKDTIAVFEHCVSLRIATADGFAATRIAESSTGINIAAITDEKSFPATIRWRYSIELTRAT